MAWDILIMTGVSLVYRLSLLQITNDLIEYLNLKGVNRSILKFDFEVMCSIASFIPISSEPQVEPAAEPKTRDEFLLCKSMNTTPSQILT